jgi:hypothetical protein
MDLCNIPAFQTAGKLSLRLVGQFIVPPPFMSGTPCPGSACLKASGVPKSDLSANLLFAVGYVDSSKKQ